jgi:hypothetical protein
MERPRLLVPLLLLLGLIGGLAARADAQGACEPTNLATQIALFCAPDMPTSPCCEPVVASVDLGGGVPCLCRVAAQPPLILARLNASHLLALYTACGGLLTGGAHLAATCQGKFSLSGSDPVVAWRVPSVRVFVRRWFRFEFSIVVPVVMSSHNLAIVFRFEFLVVPVAMNSYNLSCHLFWLFEPSLPEFVSRFGAARALLARQHLVRVTVNPYVLRLHVIFHLFSLGFNC